MLSRLIIVGVLGLYALCGRMDSASGEAKLPAQCENYLKQSTWLQSECGTCGGNRQSPINIPKKIEQCKSSDAVSLKYSSLPVNTELVVDHAVKLAVPADAQQNLVAKFQQKEYTLRNLHFHTYSEHTIAGERSAMEVHFVHQSPDGYYLVLAQLVDVAEDSMVTGGQKPNISDEALSVFRALSQAIENRLDLGPGSGKSMVLSQPFALKSILQLNNGFYSYEGSLTSAPCDEKVTWLVSNSKVYASSKDILAHQMAHINQEGYPKYIQNNYREIQALNGRKVVAYCGSSAIDLTAAGPTTASKINVAMSLFSHQASKFSSNALKNMNMDFYTAVGNDNPQQVVAPTSKVAVADNGFADPVASIARISLIVAGGILGVVAIIYGIMLAVKVAEKKRKTSLAEDAGEASYILAVPTPAGPRGNNEAEGKSAQK